MTAKTKWCKLAVPLLLTVVRFLVVRCQQDVVQARPTWQFSAQHWKLLDLRNLAVNGACRFLNIVNSWIDKFRLVKSWTIGMKNISSVGGHKSPDTITSYDPEVCYTDECIEAGQGHVSIWFIT